MKIGIVGNQQEINASKEIIRHFPSWLFVNCYDTDENSRQQHAIDFDERLYKSFLQSVDVVIIAPSVEDKYRVVLKALRNSKHVYVQHPVYIKQEKLNHLIQLANEANTVLKFQQTFKHLSLFKHLRKFSSNMHYISVVKSALSIQKNDFKYIDQLLRNDFELMFEITQGNIKKMIPYFLPYTKNSNPYLINCRIEFENGTLAQIEFQPQHEVPVHRVHVYNHSQLYYIDFIAQKVIRNVYHSTKEKVIPFTFEEDLFIWKADLHVFNDLISRKKVSLPFEYESYKPLFAITNLMDEFVLS